MPISSTSLFHFTRSFDNLKSILSNHFKPNYCLENWSNLFVEEGEFQHAFPMICFSDIPLSQVSEHLEFYGNYGIGMKKEWGIRKSINPVLYLQPDSLLAKSIATLMKNCFCVNTAQLYLFEAIFELTNYVKLYEGHIIRNGIKTFRKFYNEREWRWIPKRLINKKFNYNHLSLKDYNDSKKKEAANKFIANYKLSFEPCDIRYIIVSKDTEVEIMINYIEQIFKKHNFVNYKLLISNIITSEKIKNDL